MNDEVKNSLNVLRKIYSNTNDAAFFNEVLDKFDRMNEEMGRLHRALIAIKEGKPFNEAFDEELYVESNESDAKKTSSQIGNIIIHLFKLKYGTDPMSHNHLQKEIRNFRRRVVHHSDWGRKMQNKIIIRLVNERLQDEYEDSIKEFKNLIKDDPGDYYISIKQVGLLPEEIPWTLEDLMEDEIEDLLEVLPDIELRNYKSTFPDREE